MMTMQLGDIVPELVLLGGAVVVLLFALFAPRRRQAWAAAPALAVLALAGAFSILMLIDGEEGLTFSSTYAVDGAAVWAKLIVLAAAAVTVLLSVEWFRTDPRHGEYYTLLLFSTLGAILLAGAADVMEILLGTLLSSAPAYVLAAYHRRSGRSAEAGIKLYLIGAITNGAMVYGAMLLFGITGTTRLVGIGRALGEIDAGVGLPVAVGLIVLGLAFKLGAVPAHAWMPDVAQGSPTPVAAFLTVAPKVGALVALGRLLTVIPEDAAGWRPLVAIVAAATMTLGNLAALWQDDVRRLLGWSAVSQSGYALMAIPALGHSELAVGGLLFFLAAYAVANLAAFGVVVELRGEAELGSYRGLAGTRPDLALVLLVAFLSFVGIPPLIGFAGKLALFGAAIDSGYAWLAVVGIVNSAISLFYYLRVIAPAFLDRASEPLPVLGRWARVGALTAGIGVVVGGLVADVLFGGMEAARLLPG